MELLTAIALICQSPNDNAKYICQSSLVKCVEELSMKNISDTATKYATLTSEQVDTIYLKSCISANVMGGK